jgi:hypothetical protein
VRNLPFRLFPLELGLRNVPGYERVSVGEVRFLGRRDVFLPQGDLFWLRGASPVELLLVADQPLTSAVFLVASPAAGNRVELDLDGDERVVSPGAAGERVVLRPPGKPSLRSVGEGRAYVNRLRLRSAGGTPLAWMRRYPPNQCPAFARSDTSTESFYVGAVVTYLGPAEHLEADVFAAEWTRVELPPRWTAGETVTVPVRVVNRSGAAWTAAGGARVKLSYHWRTPAGEFVVRDGERSELPLPLAPGRAAAVALRVRAPERAGSYVLELEPVFEHVAWFAERHPDRQPASLWRAPVEVVEPLR